MAQVEPTAEEVQRMLVQFLTPNTRLIQEATVWLKRYLKQPYSIPTMCQILLEGSTAQVRIFFLILCSTFTLHQALKIEFFASSDPASSKKLIYCLREGIRWNTLSTKKFKQVLVLCKILTEL